MAHPIVHIELSSKDHKADAQWYEDVFGWETNEYPDMDYSTWSGADDSVGGGFNKVSDENPAGTVIVYIHTDDLEASKAKIKEKGGTILLESYEIPTVGTMATFKDPTGNMLALLEPAPDAEM
jgi:predicted enzyme related to lactoylglutathione lyase